MPTVSVISFKINAGENKEVPIKTGSVQPVLALPQASFLLFLQKSSPAVVRQEKGGGLGLGTSGKTLTEIPPGFEKPHNPVGAVAENPWMLNRAIATSALPALGRTRGNDF